MEVGVKTNRKRFYIDDIMGSEWKIFTIVNDWTNFRPVINRWISPDIAVCQLKNK